MSPPPRHLGMLFLLPLPGAVASVRLVHATPDRELWQVVLALPLVALPIFLALARLERNQRRAAFGLGAGWLDRLWWVWLPQLAPGLLASLLLLLLFVAADRLAG